MTSLAYCRALMLCVALFCDAEPEEYMPSNVEEDGIISSGHLRDMHAELDQNKDNGLSREELMNFVEKHHLNVALARNDPATIMKMVDASNDGLVSLDEHLKGVDTTAEKLAACKEQGKPCEDELGWHRDTVEQQVHHEKELFKAADVNNDGVLDMSEVSILAAPRPGGRVFDIMLNQSMMDADGNGDSKLNSEEFKNAYFGHLDGNAGPPIDFTEADENGDGFIDHAELGALRSGKHHVTKMVDELVRKLDVNEDKHIDPAELVHGKDEMLDSELQAYLIAWARKRKSPIAKAVVV